MMVTQLLELTEPKVVIAIGTEDQAPPMLSLDDAGSRLAFGLFIGKDGTDRAAGFSELLMGEVGIRRSPP